MSNGNNTIGWLTATGTSFEIGYAMGVWGKEAVHRHLVPSEIWARITDVQHRDLLGQLMETTKLQFPEIWEELRGLAAGLELPIEEVFAWNCRGDILASVPDGCTTVQRPGDEITITHNEDGLPFFRGSCFIVDARPVNDINFRSFCYPGSLPGHTFGWNDAHLVQAVNNLRLIDVNPQIPRMFKGRSVLNCRSLEEAIMILSSGPSSGGFHMSLAQSGDARLISVEYGAGLSSVRQVRQPDLHANHALHLPGVRQIVTQSSKDRQQRGSDMVRADENALSVLRDTSGPGLPIRRDDPDDPDHENTLATCAFRVLQKEIEWRIYGEQHAVPTYHSQQQVA
ncbi:MAG: C45 family peptidase [Proteobacteria bacterium]|nr:C45 family peptidase [Pseudomonadota bacterium]